MEEEERMAGGAGMWSLLGFDYQVDVSVWLALDVMVAACMTSELTLEHVSEEDIEADLEELEPSGVVKTVPMHGYRLIVQAKRRTGNAWTEVQYLSLLNHGKRRKSAITRLEEDPNARYLLVTSAALNDPVRHLGVRRAGSWPPATKVPEKIAKAGTEIAGRIAIIGNQDDERLVTDIKTLLLERFRVPRARWEDCLKALREAAWHRMRGGAGGRWTRDEVKHLIAHHEGYLVSGSERDHYVKPTNWGDLTQALANHHAVMIIGQSGSGKTETADALWLDRKAVIPDLQRVRITHGPDQLRSDTTRPPVLYDIDDPWGRFKFEPDSRPWNDQLARAFQGARHDRLFIATSRSDVAESSGAIASIQRWRMALDAENYGRRERQSLYRNLSARLPVELAAFTHEREPTVLQQLSLPLELRKFFDALPGLDRDELAKNPAAALAMAIEQAHRDSIERTVVDQIEARDAIKPAAILWALIKPHGRLSIDVLRSLEDPLVDRDSTLEEKLSQLVNSFITARNLRQGPDGSLAYYHGKVEAGLEAALAMHPQQVRRSLRLLIETLIVRDDDLGGNWGVETAAEIMRLSGGIPNATPQITLASQDRIDGWIAQKLAADGRNLDNALELAAAVGSPRSNVAELARWLEHRPDRTFPRMMYWGKPERDDAWYARLSADPAVRATAETFVRTVLPTGRTTFPPHFVRDLSRIAGNVTGAFLDAALTSAGYGYFFNDNVIARGAVADLDGFEAVVDAAVAARQPTEADLENSARQYLMIINEEVSQDYAEQLANDDGATADTYLEAYVDTVLTKRSWQSIAAHRHLDTLRYYWLQALAKDEAREPDAAEIEAAAKAGYGSPDEQLVWALLAKYWDQHFVELLIERMVAGAPEANVRRAALDCLSDRLPDRMPEVVAQLTADGTHGRLAQLALDLAHRATKRDHDVADRHEVAHALIAMLPDPYQELANAEVAILGSEVPALSPEAATVLLGILNPPEDVRATRLRLGQHLDFAAEDDVRWVLTQSDDHDDALAAIDVAIRRGMTTEIEAALDHRFAHVAARAIAAFAEPLAAPLPWTLLARAERHSSPVRWTLLAQLTAKPHPDHLRTLALLVGDTWSRWEQRENDDGDFPIARRAVEVIAASETVADDLLDEFIDRAKTTEDLGLMSQLLACVVRHGDEKRQEQVVRMTRKGERVVVGRAAAFALFDQEERLTYEAVSHVTTAMILGLPAMIANYLVFVIGLRGTIETAVSLADALAASDDRRIFLALLALAMRDRDAEAAATIAARLPYGHPARRWAEGEDLMIDRAMLIDLGDASAVKEAYYWMESSYS